MFLAGHDPTATPRHTRLAKELQTAELKHQLAIQRHEDEVADLCLGRCFFMFRLGQRSEDVLFAAVFYMILPLLPYSCLESWFTLSSWCIYGIDQSESIARKFQHDVLLKSLSA